MNKGISPLIAAVILIAFVIAVAGIASTFFTGFVKESEQQRGCLDSGGAVVTRPCCKSVGDFPNLCGVGACGCAPQHSHEVKVCLCGGGRCFNGEKCVEINLFEE